jgi:hypothetical protein
MFKGEQSQSNPFDGMSSAGASQIFRNGGESDYQKDGMYKQFGTDSE